MDTRVTVGVECRGLGRAYPGSSRASVEYVPGSNLLRDNWSASWNKIADLEVPSLVYRLNTYPFIHLSFLHMLFNTLALVPLMERFEADHGTLLSAAFFVGRTYRIPGYS